MKIAVVTGGAHGIGEAICRRLASDGYAVAVIDLDADSATAVAGEIEGRAYACDVGDEQAMTAMIEAVESDMGPIDVFVSNAGILFGDGVSGAASMDGARPVEDRWGVSWRVNVMAHVYAARVLVPRMIERGGGHFVNIASAAGLLSQIGDAAYSATKHAAVAFAESLAITHGDDGIRVSVVCPQAVATGLMDIGLEARKNGTIIGGGEWDGVLEPAEVADHVVDGMNDGKFMILPHPSVNAYIEGKAADYDRWIGGMRKLRRRIAEEA